MSKRNAKAFVYHAPGDVRLETLDIECNPTDIVVKILACGRCGTDKGIFAKGHPKVDPNAPIVLGHEICAEVVDVGPDVKHLTEGIGYKQGETLSPEYLDFRPGERVTTQSRIAQYENGLLVLDPAKDITILSFRIDAGYCQYMRVPKELIQSGSVLRVAENVSDEEAALVEPAACALESIFSTVHAIGVDDEGRHRFRAGPKKGGKAAVIGSGTVSLIYARLLSLEGAGDVFVFVRSQEKADLARRLLDDVQVLLTADKTEDDVVAEATDLTSGHLFDDVVAACGDPAAQRLMLQLYTKDGGACGACFGGVRERVDDVDIDVHHYRAAATVGSSGCSTRTMETIIRWIEEGRLSLKGFCSPKRYSLSTLPAEFFTTQGDGLKPILYPHD
ncbi:MAG: alcohol dehydrogenase catalytic domain-containing protein [Planctomycetes bacterium]|nr:alcohol dehydrogenase catalytic domain-containing protein [Planctomycetota bacterium]